MNHKKQINRLTLSTTIICVLAFFFLIINIWSARHVHRSSLDIYQHPYIVSNEAIEMRSRLLDMRYFVKYLLADDVSDIEDIFKVRNETQDASISIISSQYPGPKTDTQLLSERMEQLKIAEAEAIRYAKIHSKDEITQYVEQYLYPAYDDINESLLTIISVSDNKMKALERLSITSAHKIITVSILLTAIILFICFYFWYRESTNTNELRYREALFNCLANNIDDVFFIYNCSRKNIEFISDNVKRVLGVEPEPGFADLDIFSSYLSKEDQQKLQDLKMGGTIELPVGFEFCLHENDVRRYMMLRIYPEKQHEKVVRYIILIADQTSNHEIQQNLKDALLDARRANAAKNDFLSRMSHEIRTPMNTIIGMTTIASTYIADQPRVENCLNKISYSSKHLMSLINEILDVYKIEDGKINIAHEPFLLSKLVESISTTIYPQAEARRLTFKVPLIDITEECLYGDTMRLRQLLLNLLSNSLKFTPEGGKIFLEVQQFKKDAQTVHMRFTVRDTGIGMSEEFMSRIFKPFEQEDVTASQSYDGTGLGLSMTNNLVTLMGGSIRVDSKQNNGSAFIVDLDFDIASENKPLTVLSEKIKNLKILVADGDPDTCSSTVQLLANAGIHANWTLTGTEAVDKVVTAHSAGSDYDICLISWKLPDIDGIATTHRIREAAGPNPLIIITAFDWELIEYDARKAGANLFLSKPIFASSLYHALTAMADAKPVKAAETQAPSKPELSGRHVLLAEDNELSREIASEILSMMGIVTDCAKNGQEAVDIFKSSAPGFYDAILMDIQMPVMNGYEATRIIRRSAHSDAASIPILAMTANVFQDDILAALASGMDAHIAKPIDPNALQQLLAQQIEKKG